MRGGVQRSDAWGAVYVIRAKRFGTKMTNKKNAPEGASEAHGMS